jgi:hypothetical protein
MGVCPCLAILLVGNVKFWIPKKVLVTSFGPGLIIINNSSKFPFLRGSKNDKKLLEQKKSLVSRFWSLGVEDTGHHNCGIGWHKIM